MCQVLKPPKTKYLKVAVKSSLSISLGCCGVDSSAMLSLEPEGGAHPSLYHPVVGVSIQSIPVLILNILGCMSPGTTG